MPKPIAFLQHTWNAPNSLLGVLGGLGGVFSLDAGAGVVEVVGGWLARVLSRRGFSAITLGDIIIYAEAWQKVVIRDHEMVHVRQGRRWGPLFLPAYLLENASQWARTGHGYANNRFEVAAYNSHIN